MYQKKILRAKKTSYSNITETKIKVSTTSMSDDHQVCFIQEEYKRLDVKLNDYVEDISADQSEYFVMFFHPAGTNTHFKLTSSDNVWIKENHILSDISSIELSLATAGRCHSINPKLREN
ncbi:hypothetical protein PR048_015531 [Dryococelus australis]|uniref:Uncharacterized protein n=1 Tax=Dryococelus australis TaxID=614101 RepID=A0ABQ9HH61_9NEOP|nr:hypothetical protein PR048_015531 [Dryococelus australis]